MWADFIDEELAALYPLMILPGTELWRKADGLGLKCDPEPPYFVRSHFSMSADDIAYGGKLIEAVKYLQHSRAIRLLCRERGVAFSAVADAWLARRERHSESSPGEMQRFHRGRLQRA